MNKDRQNGTERRGVFGTILLWLNKVLNTVSVAVLVVTTIVVFLAVYTRYVSQKPLPWTEEIARYGFIWLSFIGIAVAESRNVHFNISYFIERTPKLFQFIAGILTNILIFGVLVIMLREGLNYTQQGARQVSTVLELRQNYIYIALPLAVGLTIINRLKHVIPSLVTQFRELRKPEGGI